MKASVKGVGAPAPDMPSALSTPCVQVPGLTVVGVCRRVGDVYASLQAQQGHYN